MLLFGEGREDVEDVDGDGSGAEEVEIGIEAGKGVKCKKGTLKSEANSLEHMRGLQPEAQALGRSCDVRFPDPQESGTVGC